MGIAWVKVGVALGLAGALLYGLWYANEQGLFGSRMRTVVYNQPLYLMHVKAVAVPRAEGQGSQWVTDMFFAGAWVFSARGPDSDNVVLLKWLGTLPVYCLIDQHDGPFDSSLQFCPAVRRIGAKFSAQDAKALGCSG
jgi:hypothetical protein